MAALSSRQFYQHLRRHEDRWQHSIGVLRLICPGPGLVLPWEMDPRLADVMLDVTIQADDNSPAMHQSFCLGEEPCGGFPMPVLTQYVGSGHEMHSWRIECKLRRKDTGQECILYSTKGDPGKPTETAELCVWDTSGVTARGATGRSAPRSSLAPSAHLRRTG